VINGGANIDAFVSNKTVEMVPVDPLTESQSTVDSLTSIEKVTSAEIQSSGTTAGGLNHSISESLFSADTNDALPDSLSTTAAESAINNAIESAMEDNAGLSSVPPVIEATESDLRHTALPTPGDAAAPGEATSQLQAADSLPENIIESITSISKQEEALDKETILQDPEPSLLGAEPLQAEPLREANLPARPVGTDLDSSTSDFPHPTLDEQLAQTSAPGIDTDTDEIVDVEMSEALLPTTKVSREREEDNETGPSPKRAKMDGASMVEVTPQNGTSAGAASSSGPISSYLEKEIIKVIKNAARTKTGTGFRAPVLELWPQIGESYRAKVLNPIDLGTIAEKLKAKTYSSMGDLYADLQLMEDNTVLFNGPVHTVTDQARQTRKSIVDKIAMIPTEPSAASKVPKPTKKAPPRRSTPSTEPSAPRVAARRPSKSSGNTFALDPATSMPTIRRDSTKDDSGRPKREIKQPKNKDLAYHAVRPKSKKYGPELRFCDEVLTELKKAKHYANMHPFLEPVDPVALNIPHYFTVVKYPMDISSVTKKLNNGEYARASDFEKDVRLIIQNCYKFNPVGNAVRAQGQNFEQLFNEQWAKKDKYVADHAPSAMSPTSSDGEESEDEIDEPAPIKPSIFTNKLVEEQGKLIALMADKKADPGIVKFQQQVVSMVQQEVNNEKAAADAAAAAKKVTKKTKAKPPKKAAAPAKKGGAGGGPKKNNKVKYMGTFEKEVISSGIQNLPEEVSAEVMTWISEELPDAQASYP
jgi:bromodomain-containing factor 1